MLATLRRRFWTALLGHVGYEGAVRAHAEDLLDYTYAGHREPRPYRKRDLRRSAHESARRLLALGVGADEIAAIRGRARLLPNNPAATAVFLNGVLVGFSTRWHVTAPAAGTNALHIATTNGGIE